MCPILYVCIRLAYYANTLDALEIIQNIKALNVNYCAVTFNLHGPAFILK